MPVTIFQRIKNGSELLNEFNDQRRAYLKKKKEKKEKQKKKKITEVRKQNSLSKAREECCFFLRKVTHINHQKI